MARPREFNSPRDLGTRVEDSEREALEKIRWREHLSESEIIRKAIQEYVKNHGDGNSSFKLDQWQENPDFKAMPAFMSPKDIWRGFIKENTSSEERIDMLHTAEFIIHQIRNKNYQESGKF